MENTCAPLSQLKLLCGQCTNVPSVFVAEYGASYYDSGLIFSAFLMFMSLLQTLMKCHD